MEPKKRRLAVLAAIIEHYVEYGEPVASKTLAEMLGDVSSATVRNDMAALAEGGYLVQPHTSAGRIPSQRGYRMYVDRLMSHRALPEDLTRYIDLELTGYSMDPDRFLTHAAQMLSGLTRMAVVTTAPSAEDACITGVELMRTGRSSCLIILMLSPAVLKSRMCRFGCELTDSELEAFRQTLRSEFRTRRVSEINLRAINHLRERLGELSDMAEPLLTAVRELAREGTSAQVMLSGQARLLAHTDFDDRALRGLMGFLSDRELMARLLAECHQSINVCIGTELGHDELSQASVIACRYRSGRGSSGWMGIIGPMRMNYSGIIPCIEYFSSAVGRIMSAIECDSGE